jgi:hypothetical protein
VGGVSTYTFSTHVNRNVVGGGRFDVVCLYRDGVEIDRWVFDGTLANWLSKRRRDKQIRRLRDLYDAVPA